MADGTPVTRADDGSSVTLIYYSLKPRWWTEPVLNVVASAATGSPYTHCEIAIGEQAGEHGEMTNVVRVFNDQVTASP